MDPGQEMLSLELDVLDVGFKVLDGGGDDIKNLSGSPGSPYQGGQGISFFRCDSISGFCFVSQSVSQSVSHSHC